MATISTRASVLAIMKETTEGTAVRPAAASDYIALQDAFSMAPNTDALENAELKSSIAPSKSILGAENPTASLDHYLRASGVEGQAPKYGVLFEASLGAVVVAGTEYDLDSGSTVSALELPTGEGSNFQVGQGLLIKDPVNGYRVRCVESISGDTIEPSFQLPTGMAPASGVNLGKAVLYKPLNDNHPTVSLWHYIGNSGALQMMRGCRVTDLSIDISAGDLIGASFSLEGIGYHFNPILIASADRYLDFTDDDGTHAAVVAAKEYKDPHDLAAALQSSMAAANPLKTPTVTYSDVSGKFTIKTTGTVLSLLWNTGANAANTIGDKIGFLTAANDTGTGATTGYTSDNAVSFAAPHVPAYESASPLAAKDNEVMLGDLDDFLCFKAASVSVSVGTPKTNISSVCSETGIDSSKINERTVTISVSAPLQQYDVDKYRRYRSNDNCRFQYTYGEKAGGNWIPGKVGAIYLRTATVTSYEVTDTDGVATLDIELTGYADANGQGEFFINML